MEIFATFWTVWSPTTTKQANVQYPAEDVARAAAKELAIEYPAEEFYVMQSCKRVIATQVQWADPDPF